MAHIIGKLVINTQESFKMITDMVMEKCIGEMENLIKVNGQMEYKLIKLSNCKMLMVKMIHIIKIIQLLQ